MDKKAEAKANDTDAHSEKMSKRVQQLEKNLKQLKMRYEQCFDAPLPTTIAQLATVLAQAERVEKEEAAALLHDDREQLQALVRRHAVKALALWEASQEVVSKRIQQEIDTCEVAIEITLQSEEDWNNYEVIKPGARRRKYVSTKFDDVLRDVMGMNVRLADRHKRFRDWLNFVVTRRLSSEQKKNGLSQASLADAVEKEVQQNLGALKADGFSKEQREYFRQRYFEWWSEHAANRLKQRAKKAAAKRWNKEAS